MTEQEKNMEDDWMNEKGKVWEVASLDGEVICTEPTYEKARSKGFMYFDVGVDYIVRAVDDD